MIQGRYVTNDVLRKYAVIRIKYRQCHYLELVKWYFYLSGSLLPDGMYTFVLNIYIYSALETRLATKWNLHDLFDFCEVSKPVIFQKFDFIESHGLFTTWTDLKMHNLYHRQWECKRRLFVSFFLMECCQWNRKTYEENIKFKIQLENVEIS